MDYKKAILLGSAIGTLISSLKARTEDVEEGVSRYFKRDEPEETSNGANLFVAGTVVGLLAGAAAALLLAPKSGRAIRRDLISKYNDLSDTANEFVNDHVKNGKKHVKRKTHL